VYILDNKWKRALTEVRRPKLANGTIRRICPESLVVSAAVVVAGQSKTNWDTKNKKRR
jgi:hypothetical protein